LSVTKRTIRLMPWAAKRARVRWKNPIVVVAAPQSADLLDVQVNHVPGYRAVVVAGRRLLAPVGSRSRRRLMPDRASQRPTVAVESGAHGAPTRPRSSARTTCVPAASPRSAPPPPPTSGPASGAGRRADRPARPRLRPGSGSPTWTSTDVTRGPRRSRERSDGTDSAQQRRSRPTGVNGALAWDTRGRSLMVVNGVRPVGADFGFGGRRQVSTHGP
jgi:hypothetical protein